MYETYWQLQAKPFEDTADARFYYPGESHQGALLKVRYAIENHRGAALLAGAAGLGKTLLVESLLAQLPDDFTPRAHLVFPDMPPEELVAYLADELTGETSAELPTVQRSVQRIAQTLQENDAAGRHAIVVIDEAHLLRETGALETVRLLLNFRRDMEPMFTLLLVGQPSLLPALDRMPQLKNRLGAKCLLRPFTQEETMAYVQHRLKAAGCGEPIFDTAALETIHYASQGVPRQINHLCDMALLIGYAEELTNIGQAQIEAVADELVTVTPE